MCTLKCITSSLSFPPRESSLSHCLGSFWWLSVSWPQASARFDLISSMFTKKEANLVFSGNIRGSILKTECLVLLSAQYSICLVLVYQPVHSPAGPRGLVPVLISLAPIRLCAECARDRLQR